MLVSFIFYSTMSLSVALSTLSGTTIVYEFVSLSPWLEETGDFTLAAPAAFSP